VKRRILVVDDEELTRLFATQTLAADGFDVREADDGVNALAIAQQYRPELIILDVLMPGKTGFEVCKELRCTREFRNTPILVMTGLDDPDSVKHAYDAGATDFVTKPISWALLCHRVQYLLRGKDALEQLARNQVLLANAQRLAGVSTFDWNHETNCIHVQGDMFTDVLGAQPRGEVDMHAFLSLLHEDDRSTVHAAMQECLSNRSVCELDCRLHSAQSTERFAHLQCETTCAMDGSPLWTHGTFQDITDRKRSEDEARRLAYIDQLTGLPNRAAFRVRLDTLLNPVLTQESEFAILFLDIDNFKHINDSLGHEAGDDLLRKFSERLKDSATDVHAQPDSQSRTLPDMVARLGGDEFTVLLHGKGALQRAVGLSERIIRAVRAPVHIAGRKLFVTTSIGIASSPKNGLDASTLLKSADTAMYAAKASGGDAYRLYVASMTEKAATRLEMNRALRLGLERNQFIAQYQPRVDARTGRIIGCEALVRWRHPDRGLLLPGEFIGIADETGTLVPIDEWMLREACRQLATWRNLATGELFVSVNVSGLQFHAPGLSDVVSSALADNGLEPQCLHIEITESVLMDKATTILAAMEKLTDIGVKVEIDDFGVGLSSLSYLNRYPVNCLKIDRCFVRNIPANRDNAAIAKAIVSLAHSLDLGVVAEGVESPEERDFLLSIGCFEMQGFLFGKAMDATEFATVWQSATLGPGSILKAFEHG